MLQKDVLQALREDGFDGKFELRPVGVLQGPKFYFDNVQESTGTYEDAKGYVGTMENPMNNDTENAMETGCMQQCIRRITDIMVPGSGSLCTFYAVQRISNRSRYEFQVCTLLSVPGIRRNSLHQKLKSVGFSETPEQDVKG